MKYGKAIHSLVEGEEGTMWLINDKPNENNELNTVNMIYFTWYFVHW